MNRRKFLKGMTLTAAGLYIPTKTFFLPPKGGWPSERFPEIGTYEFYAGSQWEKMGLWYKSYPAIKYNRILCIPGGAYYPKDYKLISKPV